MNESSSDSPPPEVLAELDAAHARIGAGFRRRDLNAYIAEFAPDLAYHQPDGRVFSRDDLARSIGAQMGRLVAFDGRFVREALSIDGNDVTEVGTQTADVAIRVLFPLAIRWKVERRGRHTWTRTTAGWRLRVVRIEWERIERQGFALGFRLSSG